jgi:manganese transport protein
MPSFFKHGPRQVVSDIFRFMGPGLLVTVGFIDPGNWAANVAAGAGYGYAILWMATLGTLLLILLQHNAAHLGIVTGLCLAESATVHLPAPVSRFLLFTAWLAAVATALAELLGAAVALRMLTGLPIGAGVVVALALSLWLLLSRSYNAIERLIIGFVSVIGLCFVFELHLIHVDWPRAAVSAVSPSIPRGALPVVMSVLGAVVMPHNLFLHSEIIQSRRWNEQGEEVMRERLKYEFLDTLFSMGIGWGINSAMIVIAAATFFARGLQVSDLEQAEAMLRPLLGSTAAGIFAIALLLAGVASSITAGMAGGSIFAGLFAEPYDSGDPHTRFGVAATLAAGAAASFLVGDVFKGLLVSQILLAVQLPITVFLQIYLTSSGRVMGNHANRWYEKVMLWGAAGVVTLLNVLLVRELFG